MIFKIYLTLNPAQAFLLLWGLRSCYFSKFIPYLLAEYVGDIANIGGNINKNYKEFLFVLFSL
jgi:hypothetical protein